MSEKGREKQVGKTDTRMIDESFISQNRFVGVAQQMDGWLVLRQNPPAATSKLGVPIAQCAGWPYQPPRLDLELSGRERKISSTQPRKDVDTKSLPCPPGVHLSLAALLLCHVS